MVLFDIPDIRLFWSNDERFTSQVFIGYVWQTSFNILLIFPDLVILIVKIIFHKFHSFVISNVLLSFLLFYIQFSKGQLGVKFKPFSKVTFTLHVHLYPGVYICCHFAM
jgi:hypothetical protein